MEHRHTDRKPMVLEVVVVCPRLGLVRGRSVNLGNGGMFVETGNVTMPINAPVKIYFQPDRVQSAENDKISGMIIHLKGQGFGMMFDEPDAEGRRLLDRLLSSQHEEQGNPRSLQMDFTATA